MPDWEREARLRLEKTKFPAADREEVARELAGHLEGLSSGARERGLSESAAAQPALAELHEDPHLGANLFRARQEGNMNDRTKQLWLPGITTLFAIVAVGTLVQLLARYFSSLRDREHAETFRQLLYLLWSYALVFIAAAGAHRSRRAGSGRILQAVAGLFPMVLFSAVFLGMKVAQGEGVLALHYVLFAYPPNFYDGDVFYSIIMPGAALLLGVLPFLCGWAPRERPSAGANVSSGGLLTEPQKHA
jgi:hypothetical protein